MAGRRSLCLRMSWDPSGFSPTAFCLEFMPFTKEQHQPIAPPWSGQRENVQVSSLQRLNALLSRTENACQWRRLSAHFGRWSAIYQRMSRRAKDGVLDRVFEPWKDQTDDLPEELTLDSPSIKVSPDGTSARTKPPPSLRKSHGGWNTKTLMLVSKAKQGSSCCRRKTRPTRPKEESCCARWEVRSPQRRCRWPEPMPATRTASKPKQWDLDPGVPPLKKSRKALDDITRSCSRNTMKQRGYSGDGKAIAESSPASPNGP